MTKAQVAALLRLIQAFDRRTVGEVDVTVWHDAATTAGWRADAASRAVRSLLAEGEPGQWLTPAHVTQRLREVRRDIARRLFTADITPPAELGGDVAAELEWRRTAVPAVVDVHLDEWARSGVLPEPTNELPTGSAAAQARLRALIGGRCALPEVSA